MGDGVFVWGGRWGRKRGGKWVWVGKGWGRGFFGVLLVGKG